MTAVVDFGKYELTARLARGGMAETYLAQLKGAAGVTKKVVIKKVLPDYADDKEFIEAFINEAKVSATLSHGNIAQVFDFGEIDGDYFIAMELVDGRSLVEVLFRAAEKGFPTLPEPIACFITIEMLKGLHYAHTKVGDDGRPLNIVHRDISPENVLIAFNGSTKVVDFGVAKAALHGRKETEPGKVKGKFQYLSPEQARGEPLDGRSDVFAVGIILYRMLCGMMPFEGQMHLVMRAIADGNFVPPQVANPALPPTLAAIIAKSMATDRKDRYASALQMQEALVRNLYRDEPTFSEEAIKEWMAWLFRPELEAEGRARVPSKRFESQLAKWDPHGPKAATSQAIRKVKPAPRSRAPMWFAGGALLLAAAIGLAVLLKPAPAVVHVPPPPEVVVDRVVFPAKLKVSAIRHRLVLPETGLPSAPSARGPIAIIEPEPGPGDAPLFAANLAGDVAVLDPIRGAVVPPTGDRIRLFDAQPRDEGDAAHERVVMVGSERLTFPARKARVTGRWATAASLPERVRLRLTPDRPDRWAQHGRPASLVVAWGNQRALLEAGRVLVVEGAQELAVAFVDPRATEASDSVTVAFEDVGGPKQQDTLAATESAALRAARQAKGGDPEAALKASVECVRIHFLDGGEPLTACYLLMAEAHARLGHPDLADKTLTEAMTRVTPGSPDAVAIEGARQRLKP